MKKKGFTLIELIAVLSILSIILVAIGGIYLAGVKRINNTKIKADIENNYRNFYQIVKTDIDKNKGDIQLFYNSQFDRWWNVYFQNESNNNIINENKGKDFSIKKAYLAIKGLSKDTDKILISFGNGENRSFYMIEVNKKDIEYNAGSNSEEEGKVDIKGPIISYRKLCDNVKKFKVYNKNNVYYFYLQFAEGDVNREYNFSIDNGGERIVIGEGDSNSNNEPPKEDNEEENILNDFYNSISGITLLNDGSNSIKVEGSLTIHNSSYYLNGHKSNNNDIRVFKNFILKNDDFHGIVDCYNIKNNNEKNIKVKNLDLKFNNRGFKIYKFNVGVNVNGRLYYDNLNAIISRLNKNDIALLKSNNNWDTISSLDQLKRIDLSRYCGAIVKESNGRAMLLTNGNITIDDGGHSFDKILFYTNNNIIIKRVGLSFYNSSIVSCNDIDIDGGSIYISGQYDKSLDIKKVFSYFIK
ncbi:type II secretion system protein [Eubacterium multiforme]|uniref:Prepilin-type N-terminal cleavage/methylation domain-containing protein n=1 Tax=Eubacterium multiforme TaxID=83339 RepID=A0ABT9UNR4_9FIRM|nr:type II secretion system protein [Eubacterium multiforme]MDQ0148280.1 prepilin-type N-terminal cleavage/methylation domain-containing protein [Eubacterium multiforme]